VIKAIIKNTFQKQNIHLIVILMCMMMQMFTVGSVYRTFAYLNLVIVLVTLYDYLKTDYSLQCLPWVRSIIFYPACFFLLHFVAQQELVLLKEMRHILLAIGLSAGVILLANKSQRYLRQNIDLIAALLVSLYVLGQCIAIWFHGRPYGTTKNPHYLAFYSLVGLIVSVYFYYKRDDWLKFIFAISMLLLGFLLLQTSSRPAWIGLFISAFAVIVFFLSKEHKLKAFSALFGLIVILSLTNLAGFTERSKDLMENVQTEERVTIWEDTWKMQMDSTAFEWVVGHGMDSFEDDFRAYSTYQRDKQIEFNSPHNYILEILYISGILGLAVFMKMLWDIYKLLIRPIQSGSENRTLYMMLFAVFTSCFIFAALILPFFNSYSMNMIAYIIGIIFYLETVNKQKLDHE